MALGDAAADFDWLFSRHAANKPTGIAFPHKGDPHGPPAAPCPADSLSLKFIEIEEFPLGRFQYPFTRQEVDMPARPARDFDALAVLQVSHLHVGLPVHQ
ncbi:MAG: hypothetical protein LCH46_06035 [Proteobacteria bacterium]|nr:hypothetical protein [Pseudomonadota bacterium]